MSNKPEQSAWDTDGGLKVFWILKDAKMLDQTELCSCNTTWVMQGVEIPNHAAHCILASAARVFMRKNKIAYGYGVTYASNEAAGFWFRWDNIDAVDCHEFGTEAERDIAAVNAASEEGT